MTQPTNARRYQFLRDRFALESNNDEADFAALAHLNGDEFDAALDAAMAHVGYEAEIAQEVEPVAIAECKIVHGHPCQFLNRTPYGMRVLKDGDKLFAAPQAVNAELCKSLQRLVIEITLSDVDPKYIESHFRVHIDNARAAIAKAEGAKP